MGLLRDPLITLLREYQTSHGLLYWIIGWQSSIFDPILAKVKLRSNGAKARTGRKATAEHKNNIRLAVLGKKYGPPSEATRLKMSESIKANWARKKSIVNDVP